MRAGAATDHSRGSRVLDAIRAGARRPAGPDSVADRRRSPNWHNRAPTCRDERAVGHPRHRTKKGPRLAPRAPRPAAGGSTRWRAPPRRTPRSPGASHRGLRRRRVLRAWRGEHGDWCPGYRRPAHPAADLTVDHVVPLAAGGGPFDIGNTGVLCRSCNSTKGGATARPEAAGVKVPETASPASSTYSTKGVSGADRGYPHADSAPVEDRASRLCARGRVSRIFPDPDHGPTQVCPWAPPLAHAAR